MFSIFRFPLSLVFGRSTLSFFIKSVSSTLSKNPAKDKILSTFYFLESNSSIISSNSINPSSHKFSILSKTHFLIFSSDLAFIRSFFL